MPHGQALCGVLADSPRGASSQVPASTIRHVRHETNGLSMIPEPAFKSPSEALDLTEQKQAVLTLSCLNSLSYKNHE